MLKLPKKVTKKIIKALSALDTYPTFDESCNAADFSTCIPRKFNSANAALNWCLQGSHDYDLGVRLALLLPEDVIKQGILDVMRKGVAKGLETCFKAYYKKFVIAEGTAKLLYVKAPMLGGMPKLYAPKPNKSEVELPWIESIEEADKYTEENKEECFRDAFQMRPSKRHFVYIEPGADLYVQAVALSKEHVHGFNVDTGLHVALPKEVFTKLEPLEKFSLALMDRALARAVKRDLVDKVITSWDKVSSAS